MGRARRIGGRGGDARRRAPSGREPGRSRCWLQGRFSSPWRLPRPTPSRPLRPRTTDRSRLRVRARATRSVLQEAGDRADPADREDRAVGWPTTPHWPSWCRGLDNRWAAATIGSMGASSLELKSGASIMAIGGFTGGDNSPTLAQFQDYVANHEMQVLHRGRTLRPTRPSRVGRRERDHRLGEAELHVQAMSAAAPSTT